jgi:transcriptional regulator with XRE-family HTH domain
MNYDEFIEKVLDGKSVNARAHELGIPQSTLSSYKTKRSVPSVGMTKELAQVAGIPLMEAIEAVAAQEFLTRSKRTSSFLRPAMASVLAGIVAVNMFLTPTPSQAAPLKALQSDSIYIMSNRLRKLWDALKAFLARTLPSTAR